MPPIYPEKHAFRIDYSKLSINEIYLALSKVGSPYVTWWASHVGVIIEIFLCIPILAYIKCKFKSMDFDELKFLQIRKLTGQLTCNKWTFSLVVN